MTLVVRSVSKPTRGYVKDSVFRMLARSEVEALFCICVWNRRRIPRRRRNARDANLINRRLRLDLLRAWLGRHHK